MMKKIMWVISGIALFGTMATLPFLPNSVPMHYDISGNIDRWGSKYENLIFPIIIIAMSIFWTIMINNYEKKARAAAGGTELVGAGAAADTENKEAAGAQTNAKVVGIVGVTMASVFAVMHGFIIYGEYTAAVAKTETQTIDMGRIGFILIGIMMIVLGNIMTKTRANRYVGVRVKWSMYNDNTWRKSNRFGAVAFMIAGVLVVILTLFLKENAILATAFSGIIIGTSVITIIYSYFVYTKEIQEGR